MITIEAIRAYLQSCVPTPDVDEIGGPYVRLVKRIVIEKEKDVLVPENDVTLADVAHGRVRTAWVPANPTDEEISSALAELGIVGAPETE